MSESRTRTILNHLETARADIEKTIDQSESREHWRAIVRGTLMFWLGELFDAGLGYSKDLQTAYAVLQAQNDKLRMDNDELKARLARFGKAPVSETTLPGKKKDPRSE